MFKTHKILPAIFLFLFFSAAGFASELQVHFINVGQGDSIFVLAPNGKKILIDAGGHSGGGDPKNPFNYIESLRKKGKIEDLYIDLAFITHAHDDHYGGFRYLCDKEEDDNDFHIANLYYSVDDPRTYGRFADCLQTLAQRAQNYGQISARGPPLEIEPGMELVVLYPFDKKETPGKEKNDDSLIMKLRYGKISFLFTGDASAKVESELLEEDIESNVLKLGHHGARTSSGENFLKKVSQGTQTFYAVISADDQDGKGKTYGHPHQETLERLKENHGVRLFRTDKQGTIVFTTNGKTVKAKVEKKLPPNEDLWEPGGTTSPFLSYVPAPHLYSQAEISP